MSGVRPASRSHYAVVLPILKGHPRVSSQVPGTSCFEVPKFPELQVPKFPELQVPVKKKLVKKTNEKLSRLIDRPNPAPLRPGESIGGPACLEFHKQSPQTGYIFIMDISQTPSTPSPLDSRPST